MSMLLSRLKVNSRESKHQQAAKGLHVNTHQAPVDWRLQRKSLKQRRSTQHLPCIRYLDEEAPVTESSPWQSRRSPVHGHPLVLRSSQRQQSQQEPLQEHADKQAHATSGSTGGGWWWGGPPGCGAVYDALGGSGLSGKTPQNLHVGGGRQPGRAPQIPRKGWWFQPEELHPGLRLLSDQARITLGQHQRLTDKTRQDMMLLLTLECTEQRLSDGLHTQEPLFTEISCQYGIFFTSWGLLK